MLDAGLHANASSEVESDDEFCFLNSLKELKELRSQIYKAADYCEKSFLNSEEKSVVLENTREYLCRAVVTVVDHLGSVSANLNRCIQNTDRVAETQLRINCLKQKLDSCDQYNQNFTLTKTRWSKDAPRLYTRYISPPSNSSCNEVSLQLRSAFFVLSVLDINTPAYSWVTGIGFCYLNPLSKTPQVCFQMRLKMKKGRQFSEPLYFHFTENLCSCRVNNEPTEAAELRKNEFKTNEDLPLFMYTTSKKICLDFSPKSPLDIQVKGLTIMPVSDRLFSVAPKLIRNPSFHFQDNRKPGGKRRLLKSMNENEIVTFIRKSKWEPSRFLKLKF